MTRERHALATALVREAAARKSALASLHRAAAILQDADDGRASVFGFDVGKVSEDVHDAIRALTQVTE